MANLSETLYAKYLKNRSCGDILENEYGFVTYRIANGECFIIDMCIDDAHRAKGKGREIIESLSRIAIEKGCDVISANIHLNDDKEANNTLLASLLVGFKLHRAEFNKLLIVKELRG